MRNFVSVILLSARGTSRSSTWPRAPRKSDGRIPMTDAVSARSLIADAECNASRFRARYRICLATANTRHLRLIAANYRRDGIAIRMFPRHLLIRALYIHSLNATLVRSTRYRFDSLHGQMLVFNGSWEL